MFHTLTSILVFLYTGINVSNLFIDFKEYMHAILSTPCLHANGLPTWISLRGETNKICGTNHKWCIHVV